ncbi:MAG TPA: energy transducer TonB [Candidatus Saccharimonadales bacterium]|nr:energy transducer TonB [Candidatus Saccharimonadales bacterium]
MPNQTEVPSMLKKDEPELHLLMREDINPPLWKSLFTSVRERLFPTKLPPLQLTSRPVKVNDIWGEYNYKKKSATVSLIVHAAGVAGLIALSIAGAKVITQPTQQVTLVAPQISDYMPLSQKQNDQIGGGGGGGDHDKLVAPKGKLPKFSMQQITPPAMVIRNDHPKLAVEPTVVVPPQVKMASAAALNFGDPKSVLPAGPASNGTGVGGGIGSGSGGGIGSGTGPGVGPGYGGGMGGGIFRVGGGVSAPRVLVKPDPDYSEEARKAKYQGTVVLWLIVDSNGKPRDVRVARSLGMGLDQKAMEAVRQWKFQPAMKDGTPVAVQINVEVNFRLY